MDGEQRGGRGAGSVKAFLVALDGEHGTFLDLADALAGKGVNLTAVSLLPGDPSRAGFTVDNEDAARSALRTAGITARELDVIELPLANAPGALAMAAHALADAGVPIELVLTERVSRGRAVDRIAVADVEQGRLVVQGLSEDGLLD
jgi:hypothetical protein